MADLAHEYAEARRKGALVDLGGRAKWRLSGADRVRYLNGQVTNDVRKATAGSAMAACVTTAKGRLCGVVYVSAGGDFLRLDAEGELREELGARLGRYIIADDAALEDVTEEECLYHVLAREAPEIEAEVLVAARYGGKGFDVMGAAEERERIFAALAARYVLISDEVAESIRIEGGVPRWGAELTEETLPPEAGLDRTAVDFHKGCYIGQEVISRIESVGHVNRRLVGFVSDAALAAGMTLHADGDAGRPAGGITSAGWSFGLETWAALGYVKRGCDGAALYARSADGATLPVSLRELPLVPPFWIPA
jgi:folate-binding protein YgfZ